MDLFSAAGWKLLLQKGGITSFKKVAIDILFLDIQVSEWKNNLQRCRSGFLFPKPLAAAGGVELPKNAANSKSRVVQDG